MARGAIGERYILGGENLTLRGLLTEIARVSGRRGPLFRVPYRPLLPLAYANELGARLMGYEPFLHRESLRLSQTRMFFDDRKARGELGYETRPVQLAIRDAVDWFSDAEARKNWVRGSRGAGASPAEERGVEDREPVLPLGGGPRPQ
jgi:dihydroflavonol-4-reductase